MIIKSIIGTTCTCLAVVSFNTSAALIERLGGLAYYDDVADLTWLADANAAQTSSYASNGIMVWADANNWAATLNVAGVTGWRLPDTLQPDASCDNQNTAGIGFGSNCSGSEMGNLFYNVLGNTAGSLSNTGPFSNVQTNGLNYWSATENPTNNELAWRFNFLDGLQYSQQKFYLNNAWAVQSGDVSAVPVPAAAWLFGSGLIGLIGFARRKA